MTKKRIIVLLDGTWNDADSGPADTNIVRLRQIISRSLNRGFSATTRNNGYQLAGPRTFRDDPTENIVCYLRGVGTGPFDHFTGGAFGEGVSENIRQAYKFLSYHYEPKDDLFVFGFSRGAHAARSLVGYIASAGLLKREYCTPENEWKTWEYYRTAPDDRFPGIWKELKKFVHDREQVKIKCLGVFETVGALGIPLPILWRANRQRYQFHDVDLSSIAEINLHALAIDEHRQPFQATPWRKPKFKAFKTVTEQVWFPGAHSDVGGGYVPESERSIQFQKSIDDISLDWMLKRLLFHTNGEFPAKYSAWREDPVDTAWAIESSQHEPRSRQFRFWRYALRSIANSPVEVDASQFQCNVGYDRHSETIDEMIHISALERLGRSVLIEKDQSKYEPKNLLCVLPRILQTYERKDIDFRANLKIVDWSGMEYDFANASVMIHLLRQKAKAVGVNLPTSSM